MSPSRALARPLLASTFIAGGIDALRNPQPRVEKVESAGLSEPDKLVQVNSAAQVAAGLTLATGRLPRLSALVLAGSLVPTTALGHPFWNETDPAAKQQQQVHFLKNLSMLGGLLLAAADTGGRESIPHAAGRVTRRTKKKAEKAAKRAEKTVVKSTKGAQKKVHVLH